MILSNGALFGPALVAVADLRVDVLVLQPLERQLGVLAERLDDLDRVDVFDERAEDRRLVAAAGADLEHLVGRLRVELLGHVGDDQGRRDRLALADRQRHVVIGQRPLRLGDKLVPRRLPHRLNHPRVFHARRDHLLIDHPVASLFQPAGRELRAPLPCPDVTRTATTIARRNAERFRTREDIGYRCN